MRIFFISKEWILIVSIALWFIFKVLAVLIGNIIPDRWLSPNSFIFKERKWEKGGDLYSKVFKIKKWKGLLPDGAAIIKKGYRKKTLKDYSKENLEIFLLESCRAELIHIIAIIPFWTFGLFGPIEIIFYMLIYSLTFNLPCIIVQRYNRPRILKLLERDL